MSEPSVQPLLFEVQDRVAVLRLNRPDQLNAVDSAMAGALLDAFDAIEASDEVRAVALLGEGRSFCAGADLKEGRAAATPARAFVENARTDLQGRLSSLGRPVVAGLHGHVLGRGLLMALACDIRIASSDARLGLPEVPLGMLPAGGGTQRLARIAGYGRALHLILTGERLDAETAYAWGLVTRVVAPEALRDATLDLARGLASQAPLAVQYARVAVQQSANVALEDGLQVERALAQLLRTTADSREGAAAFRERRKPQFRGE